MITDLNNTPENIFYPVQVRWSDMDMNRHLRHSAYYDYGATMRMLFLSDHGLTLHKLEELEIGPILFREEAIFKREIRLEDKIKLDVQLVKSTEDYARWSLRHQFIKEDGTIAAVLNIDAAWMDLVKRKLTVPPKFVQDIYSEIPRSADYQLTVLEKKI